MGDGMKGTVSDLFIHATHRFYVIFNALLNSMLIHGHSPDEFILSVLVSIPKDTRGNLLTSDNYRGIALCSALSKVVDYVILEKYSDDLQSSNLQFAYKKDHSTTMCTAVLKEVVSHYNSNGSNVFACSLDATKAFDRVNYVKLFNLLLERNLPGVIIRLLFDSYSRQFVHTRWNSAFSDPIPMENGVKQGGVLSPILFCIYFDELLKRIERTGIGCHIGHHFYGGLGYADDVVLLSPTVRGLQLLINTCEKFATEHNVTFNSRKTVCTYFGSRNIITCRQASLNSVKIPWQTSVKHLGNYLNYDLSDEIDIGKKRGDFIAAVNRLNSVFSTVQSEVKLSLLQTYCTAWYGGQAWQLGTTLADKMNVEWRKAVRRTAGLPRQTRSVLLPGLAGNENFHIQHERRFDNLFHTMLSSRNPAVSFIATKALHNTVGILGRNRAFLTVKYQNGRLIRDFLVPQRTLGSGDAPRVEQIRELIRARDGSGVIENYQLEEIILVLDYVSTYWCFCLFFFTKGIGWGGVLGWHGLINYNGMDCEFVFFLVLCLNCANLHVPCCNWLRINTIYI